MIVSPEVHRSSYMYMLKRTGETVYVATVHAAVPHFKAKLVSVLSRIMVQLKLNHPHQKSQTHKLHRKLLL